MNAGSKGSTTFLLRVENLEVEVTRKNVKTLRMRVGRDSAIKVSAPLHTPIAFIEGFVLANRPWIETAKQRAASSAYAAPRDGGEFMLWGEKLTIQVERTSSRSRKAFREGGRIVVPLSPTKATDEGLAKALDTFLAAEVKRELEGSVARMEAVTGAHADSWRVRSMTSRWGSCQVLKRSVTINAQLAHYPLRCLDYVVCHELCHLYEPSHNARFHALMDRFYPNWKAVRAELRR